MMCGLSAIAGLLVIITVYVVGFADSTEKNYPVHYRFSLHSVRNAHLLLRRIFTFLVSIIVTVAQLVARRTHDRKVVGSIPTNAVCFTVVR